MQFTGAKIIGGIVLVILVVIGFGIFAAPWQRTKQSQGAQSQSGLSRFFQFNKSPAKGSDGRALSSTPTAAPEPADFVTLWTSDFEGRHVRGLNRAGQIVWDQNMAAAPIPPASYNTNTEYVTVAPNGNLIVSDGNGMMVQELDRASHKLVWQYGHKDKMAALPGYLHQPDKAFKINDHEILVNDGNNRRVIIIDQRTNEIVWQYGETLRMGSASGLLRGNTGVVPIHNGEQFIITDTLEKKIMIIDRATKNIVWQYQKPDAKWLQHVWPTPEGTFLMEDRQRGEVFEVNQSGQILWTLSKLSDGSTLHYPTDVIKLGNGHLLIAEGGVGRVVEVAAQTGELIRSYKGVGFVTTIAIDQQGV